MNKSTTPSSRLAWLGLSAPAAGGAIAALAAMASVVAYLALPAQAQQAGTATPGQAVAGQTLSALRATDLRADKLPTAAVVQALPAGAALRLVSVEGGWALVQSATASAVAGAPVTGWVRASNVNWQAGSSAVSGLASGREASGNTALTLGVRALPPRDNRHALIIGISRYADSATPPLPGARLDKESATQMAQAMQVSKGNIKYLQDDEATGANIRKALQDLTDKVQDGDRVFIHYSGHGTRYNDPAAGGCVEALLAYDGGQSGTITNREMADMLKTITNKTDKLFVMYDACHSGGLAQSASVLRTRGMANPNDDGVLRPKFASISEECGRPVNVKTRNLVVEQTNKGALPQDIIHVSASRDNEISFDDELKGGLATQFMRDCMLRDAKDLDGSGAISMDEIRQCAQQKINQRMNNDPNFKAHNLMLNGNAAFVPAWFSQANQLSGLPSAAPVVAVAMVAAGTPASPPKPPPPVANTPAPAPAVAVAPTPTNRPGEKPPFAAVATALGTTAPLAIAVPATPSVAIVGPTASTAANAVKPPTAIPVAVAVVAAPAAPPAVPVAAAPPPPPPALTGEQALRQMFDQRDAKRRVLVGTANNRLKIGQDALDFTVQSDRAGFVYVAMAGSDNKSMYLLFPNDLDGNNKIAAGQTLPLPRPNWRLKAGGPAGTNNLLVMVTDGPRDLAALASSKAGPFVTSLNDAQGRAKLGALMALSNQANEQACAGSARKNNVQCSDAYGASMVKVEEVQ